MHKEDEHEQNIYLFFVFVLIISTTARIASSSSFISISIHRMEEEKLSKLIDFFLLLECAHCGMCMVIMLTISSLESSPVRSTNIEAN